MKVNEYVIVPMAAIYEDQIESLLTCTKLRQRDVTVSPAKLERPAGCGPDVAFALGGPGRARIDLEDDVPLHAPEALKSGRTETPAEAYLEDSCGLTRQTELEEIQQLLGIQGGHSVIFGDDGASLHFFQDRRRADMDFAAH